MRIVRFRFELKLRAYISKRAMLKLSCGIQCLNFEFARKQQQMALRNAAGAHAENANQRAARASFSRTLNPDDFAFDEGALAFDAEAAAAACAGVVLLAEFPAPFGVPADFAAVAAAFAFDADAGAGALEVREAETGAAACFGLLADLAGVATGA